MWQEEPLIEEWIAENTTQGKSSLFKLLFEEKDDPDHVYRLPIEGLRYGQLTVHRVYSHPTSSEELQGQKPELNGFQVSHLKTGYAIGTPFLSESQALRMVFCIRKLVDWKSVVLNEDEPVFDLQTHTALQEAYSYCMQQDLTDGYPTLLELIKELSYSEDNIEYEYEAVAFGEGATKVEEEPKVSEPEAAPVWGQVVTY